MKIRALICCFLLIAGCGGSEIYGKYADDSDLDDWFNDIGLNYVGNYVERYCTASRDGSIHCR